MKMLIAACHDGAANDEIVSTAEKFNQLQHCVAHSLHLLKTVDSLWRIEEIKDLTQNCRDIVTTLHFKSDLLDDEATAVANLAQLAEIQAKISEVNGVVETDDQINI